MLANFKTPILDKLTAFLIAGGAVVAGGHARWLWQLQDYDTIQSEMKPADDIDFWFTSQETFDDALALVRTYTQDGCLTPNGVRYHWVDKAYNLIRPDVRPFKTVEELLNGFDFTITQAAVDNDGIHVTSAFLEDIGKDTLRINPDLDITDPLETMARLIKYAGKGYKIDRRDILRMFNLFGNSSASHMQFLINKFNEYLGGSYQ